MIPKDIEEAAYKKYPIKLESRHKTMDELTIGYSVDVNKEFRNFYINTRIEEREFNQNNNE